MPPLPGAVNPFPRQPQSGLNAFALGVHPNARRVGSGGSDVAKAEMTGNGAPAAATPPESPRACLADQVKGAVFWRSGSQLAGQLIAIQGRYKTR